MSSREPSSCVPCQRHSVHSTSPIVSARTRSAWKSFVLAKIADQFSRTCWRPANARSGWAGCSLA